MLYKPSEYYKVFLAQNNLHALHQNLKLHQVTSCYIQGKNEVLR